MIVVLKTPSLAQRVAAAGGSAGAARERAWTAAALAAQKLLISRLAAQGVTVRPDYSFAASSTASPPSPTRARSRCSSATRRRGRLSRARSRIRRRSRRRCWRAPTSGPARATGPGSGSPGVDGRGVTIALLDTGVDAAVPYLRGRVRDGIDVVGGDAGACGCESGDPSELERHGTEMAGLLVGGGGPSGLAGVAGGATVLPIRVAGWQPDARGGWAVYARSDQLIAGLDRAVDPNDDGDAHDAARIALVALAEPFAGFADGPEARAVAGALALDTLVVAPGRERRRGRRRLRRHLRPGRRAGRADRRRGRHAPADGAGAARRALRAATLFDGTVPLAGAVAPPARLSLEVAGPGRARRGSSTSSRSAG